MGGTYVFWKTRSWRNTKYKYIISGTSQIVFKNELMVQDCYKSERKFQNYNEGNFKVLPLIPLYANSFKL